MHQQQILAAMHQLAAEGKTITTAAVRARLTCAVPLSELLTLVRRYKQAPESLPPAAPLVTAYQANELPNPVSVRLAALEHTLAEQALKLAGLEALLMGISGDKKTSNLGDQQ